MTGRRFGIFAFCLTAIFSVIMVILQALGFRLNFTDSAPIGLWRVSTVEVNELKRGQWIAVCPPASPLVKILREEAYLSPGNCVGSQVIPLLKPVSAVPGDIVSLRRGQPVTVNEIMLPNTRATDSFPAWPEGDHKVKPGKLWLFSSHSAKSIDSRYFGPVKFANVRGVAEPVFVWKK